MNSQTQKQLLKQVETNYKEIAKEYNETRKKHLEPLWEILVEYVKKIKDGKKILDVGCGNGRLIEAFDGKKIKYLGVDSSKELLKFAENQKKDYKFKLANTLELGKISETNFDYVFGVAILHHLPGANLQVKTLKQMKNKIHDDGRIFLSNWNLWSQKKYKKLIWKFFLLSLIGKNQMDFGDILFDWKNSKGESVSKRYYHAFTKRELKKISHKAGLKIEKLFKDKYNYYLILKK